MDELTLCVVNEDELYPVAEVRTEHDTYWYVHANHPERHLYIPTEILKEWGVVNPRWTELNKIILSYKYKANEYE